MYPFSCVLWAIFWSFSLLASKTHPKSSHDKFKTASENDSIKMPPFFGYNSSQDKMLAKHLPDPFMSFYAIYFRMQKQALTA